MVFRDIVSQGANLKAYAQRLSVREQVLVGGLVLVALIMAPLKAYDWSQDQLTALINDKTTLASLQAQDNGAQVRRMARQLSARQSEIKTWAWTSQSFAVARVVLESKLVAAAIQAGLVNPEVKSSPQPDVVSGINFIRVELTGAFTWTAFRIFMDSLTGLGKGFVVSSVEVQDDGTGPKFRFVALIPVVIERPNHP